MKTKIGIFKMFAAVCVAALCLAGNAQAEEEFQFKVAIRGTGQTFRIPLYGQLNGNINKNYNWVIDWGDGTSETISGTQNYQSTTGIPHQYTEVKNYTITITPAGSTDAWLGAFGFYTGTTGADAQSNRDIVVEVTSPLTPLMTRTQAQIEAGEAPTYEWAYTFYKCTGLTAMGSDFRFSDSWNEIATVGNYFAYYMFYGCYAAEFTMNEVFNLPSGIKNVGTYFASYMFYDCHGASFKMNEVFNLPIEITAAADYFAAYMFSNCYGANFKMGNAFNLPSGITTVGIHFASFMFSECYGANFTMNEVFNFPSGITAVANYFAYNMFSKCYGTFFTMNEVFNLPSGITIVANYFASFMFSGCYGVNFTMNEVFNLPSGITSAADYFAYNMFSKCYGVNFMMNEIFNLPSELPLVHNYFAAFMFSECYGANFTMNEIFNLPSKIERVSSYFAYNMFSKCYGEKFTMNEVFNLPSGILYIGYVDDSNITGYFADNMFSNCSGNAFMVNDVFKFPLLGADEFKKTNVFNQTFYNSSNASTPLQTRTATSIINGNLIPTDSRQTFTNNSRFIDLPYISSHWGGGGTPATVTFRSNGGSAVAEYSNVAIGATIEAPAAPTRTGNTFVGWYKEEELTNAWNFEVDRIAGSTTLYAKWATYTVSFDLNGVSGTAPSVIYIAPPGGTIGEEQKPSTSGFTRYDYVNDGKWHTRTGAEEADYIYTEFVFGEGGTEITGDITLYLKWTRTYAVSFNLDGGRGTTPAFIANLLLGSTLDEEQKPSTSGFTRSGYANDGKWHTRTGAEEADYVYTEFVFGEGGTEITGDITLYLKWTRIYTVSFNLDGGTGTTPASIANLLPGSTLGEEQKPSTSGFTRSGYAHDGKWYTRTGISASGYVYTEFVFGEGVTEITDDITLYLKWTRTYAVSFNLNGGTGTTPAYIADVLSGSTLSETQKPSTSGFTWSGYTHDGKWHTRTGISTSDYIYTEFVFGEGGTPVTANITLYLKWEEAETPIIKSIAKNGFGIVQNGQSFKIVGISQATPVRIYNLHGKVLMNRTAMPNESISLSHLPKGVYIVKTMSFF